MTRLENQPAADDDFSRWRGVDEAIAPYLQDIDEPIAPYWVGVDEAIASVDPERVGLVEEKQVAQHAITGVRGETPQIGQAYALFLRRYGRSDRD